MIEKLKALESAATPGPWTNAEVWCDQNSGSDSTTEWKAYKADAEFVTSFRALMPEILEVLAAVHHWHEGGEMMSISEPYGRLHSKAQALLNPQT